MLHTERARAYILHDLKAEEYVVRIKARSTDTPLCGCPAKFEADIVVALIDAAGALTSLIPLLADLVRGVDIYVGPEQMKRIHAAAKRRAEKVDRLLKELVG
jgi:hypothetical protein